MLQVHHQKYAIITLKNPTNIIRDDTSEMIYYTHDAQAQLIQWYSYNLAEEYNSHLADWVLFKDHMSTLNRQCYAEILVLIAADPFVNPQHPLSQRLYDSLLAFFDHTGFLDDSSAELSPFVCHWNDPADTNSDESN